jgi:hypothetical protein
VKKIADSNGILNGENDLPGTVFAIRAARALDQDNEKLPIGYDGESGVIYTKRSLSMMTGYVWNEITKQSREYILSFWGVVNAFDFSRQGFHVEDLVSNDLRKGAMFRTWDMQLKKFALSPGGVKPDLFLESFTIGRLQEVFNRDDQLVRMAPGCALVDFAGPGRKVFQCTVSDDHDMNLDATEELLVVAGYMELDAKGHYVMVPEVFTPPKPKLDFYWIVPYGRFPDWKKKRPKRFVKGKKGQEVAKTLRTYVNQYVLSMDVLPPSKQDIEDLVQGQLPWQGMTVVVTGKFVGFTQVQVGDMAREWGATVQTNVSSTTELVIKGAGNNKQMELAEQMEIDVLDGNEFLKNYQTWKRDVSEKKDKEEDDFKYEEGKEAGSLVLSPPQ